MTKKYSRERYGLETELSVHEAIAIEVMQYRILRIPSQKSEEPHGSVFHLLNSMILGAVVMHSAAPFKNRRCCILLLRRESSVYPATSPAK